MSSKTGDRGRGGTAGQAMSRVSVSKSRGDKSRTVMAAPLPQVSVDIVPGRLTEEDWVTLVLAEDGEDLVGDIVDSLMERLMEESLMVHLQNQLVPHTVSQARDAILQMVQWAFVPRDEGDVDQDTAGTRPEEPQPSPHDSWAQGCVPVTQPARTPRQPQVSPQHPIPDIPEGEEPAGTEVGPPVSPQIPAPETSAPRVPEPLLTPAPPPAPPKGSRPRFRPHRGPLCSAGLRDITKSLEETEKERLMVQADTTAEAEDVLHILPTSLHNILKIQLGRPPQKKDVVYDAAGAVLSVPKVDLARLPEPHVCPRVEVLDVKEASEARKSSHRLWKGSELNVRRVQGSELNARRVQGSELNARRVQGSELNARRVQGSELNARRVQGSELNARRVQGSELNARRVQGSEPPPEHRAQHPRAEEPPASSAILLDTMLLTPGVTLRKGGATESGAVCSRGRHTRRELRPIQPSVPLPSLTVEQLLKNSVPRVQPLVSFMSH